MWPGCWTPKNAKEGSKVPRLARNKKIECNNYLKKREQIKTPKMCTMPTYGQGGRRGDSPPLRVKNPPPTLRPKIGYLQRNFLILLSLWGKKIRHFWQSFTKKVLKWDKKGAKFSVWPSIVEKIYLSPPLPPSVCDPKFYPSPRASLGGGCTGTSLHFLTHSSPLWKKVGAHVWPCRFFFIPKQRKKYSMNPSQTRKSPSRP